MAWRLSGRQVVFAVASRFANRRFLFAITVVSVLGAKLVHVYTHRSALPSAQFAKWGFSFFAQDTALLLLVRLLLQGSPSAPALLRYAATSLTALLLAFVVPLGIVSVSFFAATGGQIHWRNIAFASDASSRAVLLSGLLSGVLVLCTMLAAAWTLQDLLFFVGGLALDVVRWPFSFVLRKLLRRQPVDVKYENVPQLDVERASKYESSEDGEFDHEFKHQLDQGEGRGTGVGSLSATRKSGLMRLLYLVIGIVLLAQFLMSISRPNESAMVFMSWTPAILPFVDFSFSSPTLGGLQPFYHSGIDHNWDSATSLVEPKPLPWLPKDTPLPGFEDWYTGDKHYSASSDPQKISNLEDQLLPKLRNMLTNVPIRHVMLIKLESTRKDVFPIKKDGVMWKTLAESFANGSLPEEAQKRLATLTPTANFLTGDYNDGFEHPPRENMRRGGINFNNAYSTSTYTLKSITGSVCGISPLVADFNIEYKHHIYQPCFPQILEAFNHIDHSHDNTSDRFTTFKWQSSFMQSVTLKFDNFDTLMMALGYPEERLISKEYLKGDSAKFGKVDLPDVNYFGPVEAPLEDYIRDAFVSAKEKQERVFLTHVTSTSHHPFGIPSDETVVELADGLDDLSHYVNAIGYDDRWLQKVLDVLEEQKVADETLLIVVGDHGLSMPENGKLPTYYNPNAVNDHVPLILSHPKLPPMEIDDPVSTIQILPTILDLLLETGSLSESQSQAAHDLIGNYEGQSLIRPLRTSSTNGQGNWHFTNINPGGAMIAARDARHPNRRLVVPTMGNIEWRYSDLESDPLGETAVLGFSFVSFLDSVEHKYGIDAAKWAEEGAFMARWWVEENSKRWRYGPYEPEEEATS